MLDQNIRAQNHFDQPVSPYQEYEIKHENELFQLSLPIDNINLEVIHDEDDGGVQLYIKENLAEQISMSLFKEMGIKMASRARFAPAADPDFVLY